VHAAPLLCIMFVGWELVRGCTNTQALDISSSSAFPGLLKCRVRLDVAEIQCTQQLVLSEFTMWCLPGLIMTCSS
jgi:hypothetical protein